MQVFSFSMSISEVPGHGGVAVYGTGHAEIAGEAFKVNMQLPPAEEYGSVQAWVKANLLALAAEL